MFGRESFRDFLERLAEEFRGDLREISAESNARWERALEETREFNREILLRNEKVYTGVIVRLEELGEETRENTAQTRANTQAVLRALDRLDDRGDSSA